MTVAYVCVAALLVLSVAAVRHGRPAISVPAVITVLATAGWNLTRAVRGPEDHGPSLIAAISILTVEMAAVSFFVLCRRLVLGRWRGPAWMWIAMVWFSTATFVGMLPAMGIIAEGQDYRESPVFLAHLVYSFGFLGAAVLTLNMRQHDQSRHVRRFIIAAETAALLTVTFQVVEPSLTSIIVAVIALLAVWTTAHPGEWSRSASRADRLLDSIGVFIFVVDCDGRLRDWNGPAASLLELTGTPPKRGLNLSKTLGIAPTFVDGLAIRLEIQHGTLRTALSVHQVDPLARNGDLVLMFRPVRSSVESSSFPVVSGELQGHDPATQTLGRKAAVELLQRSAEDGTPVLRLEVTSRADRRPDEVMFLLARRIEARSVEEGWPEMALARLDTWTFVGPLLDPDRIIGRRARYDDLGLDVNLSVHRRLPSESAAAFTRRVEEDLEDGTATAQGG